MELWRGGKACFHDFGQIACFLLSEMSPLSVINQNYDDGGGDIHVAVMAHNDK